MNNFKISLLLFFTFIQVIFFIIGFTKKLNYNFYDLLLVYEDFFKVFLLSFIFSFIILKRKFHVYVFFGLFCISILFLLGFYKFIFISIFFIINAYTIFHLFFKNYSYQKNFIKIVFFSICLYILVLNILIFFPVNNFQTYFLLLILPIFALFKYSSKLLVLNKKYLKNKLLGFLKSNQNQSILDVFIVSILSIYFFVGLMPESGYDALATHLFIPSYLQHYKMWDFDVNSYIWAVFPLGGELFYSFFYILADEQSSKLSLFLILIIILKILHFICSKINIPSKSLILLTITTPLIYLEASSMFIDLFWLMSGLMLIALLINVIVDNKLTFVDLVLLFFTVALFINSKLIALIYIAPLLVYFLYFIIKNNHFAYISDNLKTSYGFLLIPVLWALSPFVISYWHTSNPVFPFFNAIFDSELNTVGDGNFTNSLFSHFIDYKILYNITFNSQKYLEASFGAPGFFWMLLFIPMSIRIFCRKYDFLTNLYIYSLLTFTAVFFFQSYLRYVIPSFIFIYLVFQKVYFESSCLYDSFNLVFFKISKFLLGVCILLNLFLLNSASLGNINLGILLNDSKYNNYIETHLPIKKIKEYINNKYKLFTNNQNILFLSNPHLAYSPVKPIIINWYNANAYLDFFKSLVDENTFISFSNQYNFSLIVYEEHIFMNYLKDRPDKNIILSNFLNYTEELERVGPSSLRIVKRKYINE